MSGGDVKKSSNRQHSTFRIPKTETSVTVCFDGTRIWKHGAKILTIKDSMDYTLNLQDCELCWILISACTKKPIASKKPMASNADEALYVDDDDTLLEIDLPEFLERNILSTKIDPDVFVGRYDSCSDSHEVDCVQTYFHLFRFYSSWPSLRTKRGTRIGMAERINFDPVPFIGDKQPERHKCRSLAFFSGLSWLMLNSTFFSPKLLQKSMQNIDNDTEFIKCLQYGITR